MALSLKGIADKDKAMKLFQLETVTGDTLEIKIRSPYGLDETLEYTRDVSELNSYHKAEDSSEELIFEKTIMFIHKWMEILSEEDLSVHDVITALRLTRNLKEERGINPLLQIIFQVSGSVLDTEEEDVDDLPFSLVDTSDKKN